MINLKYLLANELHSDPYLNELLLQIYHNTSRPVRLDEAVPMKTKTYFTSININEIGKTKQRRRRKCFIYLLEFNDRTMVRVRYTIPNSTLS